VLFKTLLAIDILTSLVIGGFFFFGLADGSVSFDNIPLWVGILFAVTAIVAGGLAFHSAAKTIFANLTLALLAVPAVLYGLFIVVFVVSGSTWN